MPERYLYDFDVYTGATGERETSLGEKAVLSLSETIQGRYHQLFYNYFSSISLQKLLNRGTYACGTIRTNRNKFPSEISAETKNLQRGGATFRQCGNIVAKITKWSM